MMTPRRWRSRTGMLLEGSTDGKYNKHAMNWSTVPGMGLDLTTAWRSDLNMRNALGTMESPHKHVPGQWTS